MLSPDNGIVRVGMEIEIVKWKDKRTYQKVAADLIKAGFMSGTADDWATSHPYAGRVRFRKDPPKRRHGLENIRCIQ